MVPIDGPRVCHRIPLLNAVRDREGQYEAQRYTLAQSDQRFRRERLQIWPVRFTVLAIDGGNIEAALQTAGDSVKAQKEGIRRSRRPAAQGAD